MTRLNMSESRALRSGRTILREKISAETGERYWVELKLSWGRVYYSVDGGDTWHRTAGDARRASGQESATCQGSR